MTDRDIKRFGSGHCRAYRMTQFEEIEEHQKERAA